MALCTRGALLLGVVAALGAIAGDARGDAADLKQAIADLSSQAKDKTRMDTLGAAKIELSQVGSWIDEASNAVQEKAEKKCRTALDRIRAQLVLVDQRIALSQLEAQAQQLETSLAEAKKASAAAKRELEDKQAKLRAIRITQPR